MPRNHVIDSTLQNRVLYMCPSLWNGRVSICAKELANENNDFELYGSVLSFRNIARTSIHHFVEYFACSTAAHHEQRGRATRGHAQAIVSGRSLVWACHRSRTRRTAAFQADGRRRVQT